MEKVKAGQTVEHAIGGRTLVVAPIPIGKLKAVLEKFKNTTGIDDVADMYGTHLVTALSFNNEGLTKEFIQDNVSLPLAQQILGEFALVNGLPNFFQEVATSTSPEKTEKELAEAK